MMHLLPAPQIAGLLPAPAPQATVIHLPPPGATYPARVIRTQLGKPHEVTGAWWHPDKDEYWQLHGTIDGRPHRWSKETVRHQLKHSLMTISGTMPAWAIQITPGMVSYVRAAAEDFYRHGESTQLDYGFFITDSNRQLMLAHERTEATLELTVGERWVGDELSIARYIKQVGIQRIRACHRKAA